MAQVKYGAIITELKGSIGGHTFKATRMGGAMQTKINRAPGIRVEHADAGRVINPKINTIANSSTWRNLSPSERNAWNAAGVNFPFLNRYGEPYTPSGYQLYMSCNNNLLNIGETVIAVPPAPDTIDACPAFTVDQPTGANFNIQMPGGIPAGYVGIVSATANQSAGRGFDPGRLKAVVLIDSADGATIDMLSEYTAIFGTPPGAGTIFVNIKITKGDAGRSSLPNTFLLSY